jgi:hypothetical protein
VVVSSGSTQHPCTPAVGQLVPGVPIDAVHELLRLGMADAGTISSMQL